MSSGPRVWSVPLHTLQAGQATGPEWVSSRAAPHLTPSPSTAAQCSSQEGPRCQGFLAGQAADVSHAHSPQGGLPCRLQHIVKAVKQFPCQGFTRIQESLPGAKHPLNTMPPAPRSAAAASRPYIGKSLGIPHPSSGWALREAPAALARPLGSCASNLPLSGRGAGCGGQVGGGGPRGVPSARSPSGRASASSYQIRPGQLGLHRLRAGRSRLPTSSSSCTVLHARPAGPANCPRGSGETPPRQAPADCRTSP